MTEITIEKPAVKDIPQMRKWARENRELWVYEKSAWHDETTLKDWIQNPKDDLILVAKEGNKTVGMILVYLLRDWALCSDVFVVPQYRRKGIGKALIKKALEHFKSKGIDGLHLVTHLNNSAINFYKKLGFKKGYNFVWMRKEVSEAL